MFHYREGRHAARRDAPIVTHGVINYRLIVDNDIFPCTLFRVAVIANVRKLTLTYVSEPNFAQLSN